MRWCIPAALISLLLSGCLRGEPRRPPIRDLMPLLADLAERGAYGVHHTERGAFLVRQSNGKIRCVLWPFTGQFHRISYSASIPPGTIAIAHTHPRCCQRVSAQDKRLASLLNLPIIAVSMGTLHIADIEGKATVPQRGIDWSRFADDKLTCSENRSVNAVEDHDRPAFSVETAAAPEGAFDSP